MTENKEDAIELLEAVDVGAQDDLSEPAEALATDDSAHDASDSYSMTLDSHSVSEDAEQLLQEFLDHRGSDIEIDAAKVERFDTPCVEVLLSAARTWADAGHAFELKNIPAPLKNCLEILAIDQAELEVKETA